VIERRANDIVTVNLDIKFVRALGASGKSILNEVSAVLLVGKLDGDGARGTLDGDLEGFTALAHVLVGLCASTDHKLVTFNEGSVVVSTFLDIDVVRAVSDGLVLEGDLDLVLASVVGLVVDGIGTITIVLNLNGNISVGTLYLDIEGIATMLDGVALGVASLDGEVGGQVVLNTFLDTRTIDLGLAGVGTLANFDVERRVFDVLIVLRSSRVLQANSDLVLADLGGLV
jgi:hypothetical protein